MKNPEFGRRVLSVMIDEAHVVSHWGTEFRKKYGTLGIIRAFLPRGTPIVAVSATLPARVRQDVLSKLQFGKDYVNIDEGNDRPNVSIVVRAIHEQMQTYGDLDFVVDGDGVPVKAVDIKKAFIYADRVSAGTEIEDHLEDVLPPHLRGTGIIRPYNAAHGHAYLKRVMKLFRGGVVRVLVCTDAAGMVSPELSMNDILLNTLFPRDVTYLILMLLSSGSCLAPCLRLSKEQAGLQGVRAE